MTNLAHLQDLFRHFSTLLDVMFLPQGSTTLLNAFDGDESSLWKAQLLGCSAARLLSFLHWEVPDVGPEITGMGIIKISMRFLGPQWATKDTSKHFKRCKPAHIQSVFVNFIVPLWKNGR